MGQYEEVMVILNQIKNETNEGGNTKQRIYDAFKKLLDYATQVGIGSTEIISQLNNAVAKFQSELDEHESSVQSHQVAFQNINNKIEEIEQLAGGSAIDLDITNLLTLRDSTGMLLVTPINISMSESSGQVLISGNIGNSITFTGVPTVLGAGKYSFSFQLMKGGDVSADKVYLVKQGGQKLEFMRDKPNLYTIELDELTPVRGINYELGALRDNLTMSRLALVKGRYVGYTLPYKEYYGGINKKIDVNLGNIIHDDVRTLTDDQFIHYFEVGKGSRKTTLRYLSQLLAINGGRDRQVLAVEDLKGKIFATYGDRFIAETATVYLNGQALFQECEDFIVLDDTHIQITAKNVNDLSDTDKVVLEAIINQE